MAICLLETGVSVVPDDPMGTAVFSAPPIYLLVTQGVGFLCDLTYLFRLQGLDLPLELLNSLLHRLHGGVLGRYALGLS